MKSKLYIRGLFYKTIDHVEGLTSTSEPLVAGLAIFDKQKDGTFECSDKAALDLFWDNKPNYKF